MVMQMTFNPSNISSNLIGLIYSVLKKKISFIPRKIGNKGYYV